MCGGTYMHYKTCKHFLLGERLRLCLQSRRRGGREKCTVTQREREERRKRGERNLPHSAIRLDMLSSCGGGYGRGHYTRAAPAPMTRGRKVYSWPHSYHRGTILLLEASLLLSSLLTPFYLFQTCRQMPFLSLMEFRCSIHAAERHKFLPLPVLPIIPF